MTHALRLAAMPGFLLLCLLLGGASAAGFWANLVLQLIGLAIILWAVASRRSTPLPAASRQALAILGLGAALILLQLVPLPPSIWTHLPGRGAVADGYRLIGRPLPWLPISLEPYRTIASALWLLPAVALFLGMARLGAFKARWLAWVLAAVTIVSVALGALQIAGGAESPWYLYRITNIGAMTGFFSNANHLATLLLATLPFLAALYLEALGRGRSLRRSSGLFVLLVGTAMIIMVGLAGATSIAGAGLFIPVTGASIVLVAARKRRPPVWAAALVLALLVGSVGAVFTAPFDNNLTGARAHKAEDSRYFSFTRTGRAAADYFPVGSGIGTFQAIYRSREDPAAVNRYYMNHTHSDYIELALETGLPGLLVVLAGLLWWAWRSVRLWTAEDGDPFARAASIAAGAILAHSIVDYPLRTAAIGAVFATCCALMADSRAKVRAKPAADAGAGAPRHLSAD
jgi:O-antigen ligase